MAVLGVVKGSEVGSNGRLPSQGTKILVSSAHAVFCLGREVNGSALLPAVIYCLATDTEAVSLTYHGLKPPKL